MTISTTELKPLLDEGKVVLIDVRSPGECAVEYIEGAVFIPVDEVCFEALPETQGPIVFYCQIGRRSAMACAQIHATHPDCQAYSIEGGMEAWKAAGFPVKTG